MKVRILRPALEDLATGRQFYDRQRAGAGDYFFNSLFSEIDSLALYAGIHRTTWAITDFSRSAFRMRSTTGWWATKQLYIGCSIVAETLIRFGMR